MINLSYVPPPGHIMVWLKPLQASKNTVFVVIICGCLCHSLLVSYTETHKTAAELEYLFSAADKKGFFWLQLLLDTASECTACWKKL